MRTTSLSPNTASAESMPSSPRRRGSKVACASRSARTWVPACAGTTWRRYALLLLTPILLTACERAKQDMYDQPRYKTFAAGPLFEDGASARVPPTGTQPRARGPFSGSSSGRLGADAVQTDLAAAGAETNPYPVDQALLERGRNRYMIYCMPCHSPAGDGDGLVVRRGFPAPPTYHQDRLRSAPDRHFYDVITNGYGVMVPYADRLEPADRWAIVAFIRALQFSQYAPVAGLPADVRAQLDAASAPPKPPAQEPARASDPSFAPPLTQPPTSLAPRGRAGGPA